MVPEAVGSRSFRRSFQSPNSLSGIARNDSPRRTSDDSSVKKPWGFSKVGSHKVRTSKAAWIKPRRRNHGEATAESSEAAGRIDKAWRLTKTRGWPSICRGIRQVFLVRSIVFWWRGSDWPQRPRRPSIVDHLMYSCVPVPLPQKVEWRFCTPRCKSY